MPERLSLGLLERFGFGEQPAEKLKAARAEFIYRIKGLVPSERERRLHFARLRVWTHEQMTAALSERLRENPHPTDDELLIGAFAEEIEPQVRNAVFELNRKGYSTSSSGFYGRWGEYQAIDGRYRVDTETKARLQAMGVNIKYRQSPDGSFYYTSIGFSPPEPNIEKIKTRWNLIADMLPDTGQSARPSNTMGSQMFRARYTSPG